MSMALLALLVVCVWGYGRLSTSQARASDEGEAWSRSDRLAKQIQALRDQPTMADDHAMQKADMTRRIAKAVSAASLDEKRLVSIDHQTARRIGRTPYLEKPTRLTLRDVDMPGTLSMLYSLTQGNSRLNVSRLRFTAPQEAANSNAWTVDTTVTYLIYEPTENDGS